MFLKVQSRSEKPKRLLFLSLRLVLSRSTRSCPTTLTIQTMMRFEWSVGPIQPPDRNRPFPSFSLSYGAHRQGKMRTDRAISEFSMHHVEGPGSSNARLQPVPREDGGNHASNARVRSKRYNRSQSKAPALGIAITGVWPPPAQPGGPGNKAVALDLRCDEYERFRSGLTSTSHHGC